MNAKTVGALVAVLVLVCALGGAWRAVTGASHHGPAARSVALYTVSVTTTAGDVCVDSISVGLPDSRVNPATGSQRLRWRDIDGEAHEYTTAFGQSVEFAPIE